MHDTLTHWDLQFSSPREIARHALTLQRISAKWRMVPTLATQAQQMRNDAFNLITYARAASRWQA